METRGRKTNLYPQELIDNIVYCYTQEEKVKGWIKYSEVFRFSNKLYEKNDISVKLSEDFWRKRERQGRQTIDRANKLYEATLVSEKTSNNNVIINTEECVNLYFNGKTSDKKKLVQALKINEKKATDANKLLIQLEKLKNDLAIQKEKYYDLEKLNEQYQTILFSWFYASLKRDVPLINLMSIGESKHPIIDLFFDTAFSNPLEGYEKFGEYCKIKKSVIEEDVYNQRENVVTPLRKNRIQQLTEELYKNNDLKE